MKSRYRALLVRDAFEIYFVPAIPIYGETLYFIINVVSLQVTVEETPAS